jgi:hypothetical protein
MAVATSPPAARLPTMMNRICVLLKLRLKMKEYSIEIIGEISLIHTLEQPLLESMVDWLRSEHHLMDSQWPR